jgi:uncharacterized protein (DUF2249 family)
MATQDISQSGPLAGQELKNLAAAAPPCVTLLLPLPEPAEIHIRLKNAIRSAEKGLKERNVDPGRIEELMEPVHALTQAIETEGWWGNGLVALRSPAVFRHFWVRKIPTEMVTVADHFPVLPLLSLFSNARIFYVLALSKKNVDLFRGADDSFERMKLPDAIPTNLNAFLNTRKPDHVLDNRAFGGPSAGSMKGVMFGTSTDRESRDQPLLHFFKEIEKGIHTVLKDTAAPLILAGVEYEVALYRKVNTYPRLMDDAVYGSPDSLRSEMHERTLQIIQQHSPEPLRTALAQLEQRRGSTRVSFDMEQILQAAHDGRVADLFLRQDNTNGGDDKINAAAIQTLLHAGQVFALSPDLMPDRAALAAVMRY